VVVGVVRAFVGREQRGHRYVVVAVVAVVAVVEIVGGGVLLALLRCVLWVGEGEVIHHHLDNGGWNSAKREKRDIPRFPCCFGIAVPFPVAPY
jgi:hypothetical protein